MSRRRKNISLKVKLEAALLQLGLDPDNVELDHDPPLAMREFDPQTGAYTPADDDPRHLVWRSREEHRAKTTGRKGESKLSISFDGDVSKIAKMKRVSRRHQEFERRLLARDDGGKDEDKPRRRWPKRPFPNKRRKHGQTTTSGGQAGPESGRPEGDRLLRD